MTTTVTIRQQILAYNLRHDEELEFSASARRYAKVCADDFRREALHLFPGAEVDIIQDIQDHASGAARPISVSVTRTDAEGREYLRDDGLQRACEAIAIDWLGQEAWVVPAAQGQEPDDSRK